MFDPNHNEMYRLAMIGKYGVEEVESLMWKSRSLAKFTRYELEEIIETYKQKLKSLIASK
jgi:hypothetical protein